MRWGTTSALALLLLACSPVGPSVPTLPSEQPQPSPSNSSPSTQSSQGPSSAPSVGASTSPGAQPKPSAPSPSGYWAAGSEFRSYDWLGLGRPFYDRGTHRLYVADAVAKTPTHQRYQLLRFDASSGAFLGTQSATPTDVKDAEAPAGLDAVTFDLRGIPLMGHVDKDQHYRLLEAFSATVRIKTDFQVTDVPRIGMVSLASDGLVLTQVLLRLDDDKNKTGNRRWLMTQSEPGENPQALFNEAEPYPQTLFMAASPKGGAFVVALRSDGKPALVRLQAESPSKQELSLLRSAPDGLYVDQDGSPLVVENKKSEAAVVVRLDSQGQASSSTPLLLQGGGFLTEVMGLCPDGRGGLFVTGRGLDGTNRSMVGLYRFPVASR